MKKITFLFLFFTTGIFAQTIQMPDIPEDGVVYHTKTSNWTFGIPPSDSWDFSDFELDDEVDVNLIYFNHDKKRLQYKMEMIHKKEKYLASTIEVLALYVDLNTRKVSEFEQEKIQIMDSYIQKNKSQFTDQNLKFSSKLKK